MPSGAAMLGRLIAGLVCSTALLALPYRTAIAQAPGLSTINVLHEFSFQYPSTWGLIPDSAHFSGNPQGGRYDQNEAVELKSPDDVVEVWVYVDSQTAGPSAAALGDIFSSLSGAHSDFQVIQPISNAHVQGADSSSQGEASYTFAGAVQDFYFIEAMRADTLYNMELVWTEGQLAQYQSQVNAIGDSFQLLP
jgi:hypothetical protein